MRHIAITLALTMIGVVCCCAQMRMLASEYDFGVVSEQDGPQRGEVKMVNDGTYPIEILRVRTTCGCTSADYDRGPIAPGDTATVWFVYDTTRRPGRFDKSVKVYFSDMDRSVPIRIHGTVIGTESSLIPKYPVASGGLRAESGRLDIGEVAYGTAAHDFLSLYNQTGDTITPRILPTPEYLDVKITPEAIPAGDLAMLGFSFNTRRGRVQMGRNTVPVSIVTGTDTLTVDFAVDVVTDARRLTPEEVKNGSRANVAPTLIDLGNVAKRNVNCEFLIENLGNSPLNIERIYSDMPGVKVKRYPVSLKPKKRGICQMSVDLTGVQQGAFSIPVDVISNDPLHPLITVRIVGIKE